MREFDECNDTRHTISDTDAKNLLVEILSHGDESLDSDFKIAVSTIHACLKSSQSQISRFGCQILEKVVFLNYINYLENSLHEFWH